MRLTCKKEHILPNGYKFLHFEKFGKVVQKHNQFKNIFLIQPFQTFTMHKFLNH